MNLGPVEIVVFVVLWVIPCVLVASHAAKKGYNYGLFFVGAFFVSWVIALIAALVLPDRRHPDRAPAARLKRP